MSAKARWKRLKVLYLAIACLFGAVSGKAQVDSLSFGTNHVVEMTNHNVTLGSGILEADRYRIGGFGDMATWNLMNTGLGSHTLEAVLGIGTTRQATVNWVVNGVTNTSGLIVGVSEFAIVTNRYVFAIPTGTVVQCSILTPTNENALPSIYSSALYGAPDCCVLFGSDNEADMIAHLVDGHDTVTVLPDYLQLNGDFATVTWELATQGAGNYALEAVQGLGTGRRTDLFWGVDGVTNASGELAGFTNFDILTNRFGTYQLTVPDGVATIQLLLDGIEGLPSIFSSRLLGGPPDSSVLFGSDNEDDMASQKADGHDEVTMRPDNILINGPWTCLTWELETQGAGNYALEAVLGLGVGRRCEIFWGVDGVTNASGELAGFTNFDILTNRFGTYQVTVPDGVSSIQLLLDGRTTGLASIYSSRLFGGLPDNAVQFGSDHEADMASHKADGHDTVTVLPDQITLNGDFSTLTWELETEGVGDYSLDVVLGLGSSRRAELFWGVAGVTNSSGELVASSEFEIVERRYSLSIPGGVTTIQCLYDSLEGLPSMYSAALNSTRPETGLLLIIK